MASEPDAEIYAADEIDNFEEEYRLPDKIPCTIASCHQPHAHGYRVRLKSGSFARIGHICGRQLLGEHSFVLLERDLSQRKLRKQRQRFISSPDFDPAAVIGALPEWRRRVGIITTARDVLRATAGDFLASMERASQTADGRISAFDYATGTARRVRIIRGRRWLAEPNFHVRLANAAALLRKAKELLDKEGPTDGDLEQIVRSASIADSDLQNVADVIDDYDLFCTEENLSAIAEWMQGQRDDADVCIDKRGLYMEKDRYPGLRTYFAEFRAREKIDRSIFAHLSPVRE